MQAEPQHTDRRLEQRRVDAGEQWRNRLVGCDQRPVPVNGQRRKRLVRRKHKFDGLPRRRERRMVERPLLKLRRKARRDQERVALAQRHVELLRKPQHHVA